MSQLPTSVRTSPQGGSGADPPTWEVPELIAVAVLASVALVAVGGLVTGITRSFSSTAPFSSSQDIWSAIELGAEWANVVLAAVVLGVLGVCWWQLEAWREVREEPEDEDALSEALGHMQRTRWIISWAMIALGVTAAGSVAGFVAQVGSYGAGPVWAIDIWGASEMLAVIVVSTTGIFVGRRLRD